MIQAIHTQVEGRARFKIDGLFGSGVLARVQDRIGPNRAGPLGVFQGLANPFEATRYHSLVIDRQSLPECLIISAWTAEQEIMGVSHRDVRPALSQSVDPAKMMAIQSRTGSQLRVKNLKAITPRSISDRAHNASKSPGATPGSRQNLTPLR